MDQVRIQFAWFDQLLDFGDGDFGGCRHHGIKIPRRLAVDEIAPLVALPRFDEREIAFDGVFHHIWTAVELAGFFAFGNDCAVAGGRVERRNSRAAGANALGECSLRNKVADRSLL